MRIAVLMTCHNRLNKTYECLVALFNSDIPEDVSLHAVLVDDGSTDGTAEFVRQQFPQVRLLYGDGNLFWNRGMHKAFAEVLSGGYDAYLWLNDDTLLYPDTLVRLLKTWQETKRQYGMDCLVVGSTRDAVTGAHTYGGVTRPSRWKPMSYTVPIYPGDKPVPCDTINGNCVLIPRGVAERVGNLDPVFQHAMGDTDYGLRARRAGFPIWVLPGYAGTCSENSSKGGFNDPGLPLSLRLKKMMSPKGLPPGAWWTFTRRHAGIWWPLYWAWPYVRVVLTSLLPTGRRADAGN